MSALNPVLRREVISRSRSWRAVIVLMVFLALQGAVVYSAYQTQKGQTGPLVASAASAGLIGRSVFDWLSFVMVVLVLFIVPGLVSGTIAGERERQTLIPLQVTLLRPRSIVLGKILAALAYVVLLIIASMPLLAVAFLIGGIALSEIVKVLAYVLALAFVLAAVSTWLSTQLKRVQTATVTAYGLVLVLSLGTFLIYGVAGVIDRNRGTDRADPPPTILAANPIAVLADLTDRSSDPFASRPNSPFNPIRSLMYDERNLSGLRPGVNFPQLPGLSAQENARRFGIDLPTSKDSFGLWRHALAGGAASAALGIWLSTRRIRTPARTER